MRDVPPCSDLRIFIVNQLISLHYSCYHVRKQSSHENDFCRNTAINNTHTVSILSRSYFSHSFTNSVNIHAVDISCVHLRRRWEGTFIECLPNADLCYSEVDTVDTLQLQVQWVKWHGRVVWCGKHCISCYTGCLQRAMTSDMGHTEEALLRGWHSGWSFPTGSQPSMCPHQVLLIVGPWASFQSQPPTISSFFPRGWLAPCFPRKTKNSEGTLVPYSPAVLWPGSYHSQIPPVTESLASCFSAIVHQSTSIFSLSPTSPPLRPSPHTL